MKQQKLEINGSFFLLVLSREWGLLGWLCYYRSFLHSLRLAPVGFSFCFYKAFFTLHVVWKQWSSKEHRQRKQNRLRCYPQQLENYCLFAIKVLMPKNTRLCHKQYKCLCHKKTSEPFGFSESICTRTLQNLTRYLHRNPPEPHKVSGPEPYGTSLPHHVTAAETSGTSPGTCTKTL